MQSFV
jgi:hypothetical protein